MKKRLRKKIKNGFESSEFFLFGEKTEMKILKNIENLEKI